MLNDRRLIQLGARVELARRFFFDYCRLKAPDFYRPDRKYLVDLCNDFQEFLECNDKVMIINLPPRHGKSRTACCFAEWYLGQDPNRKIMIGSYNETLSTMFSKNVRNTIQELKADKYIPVFSDVFPGVRIKEGDAAMNLWSLKGGYNNYLATSPSGTATGFGCTLMIIDDLIKNAEEANNEMIKEKHWEWFTNTMLSRREEGAKIIIIMTRWSTDDLAGRYLDFCQTEGIPYRHICMKAYDEQTNSMLCSDILSLESYQATIKAMGADIAAANYQQEPINIKGKLYTSFKTYTELPPHFEGIYSYTDTADEGSDWLCSIIWGVYQQEAYILDIYFSPDPMEITEPETALRHKEHQVNNARIESNNGGKGFARNVERISKQDLKNYRTIWSWFHQSANKKARILTYATWVMNHIYYPVNWRDRFPEYYEAMNKYQREGKNAHDDAPDATTGIAETMQQSSKVRTSNIRG